MHKALTLQLGVVAAAAALAAWWLGARGAISVLMGGASYLIPNMLFVLRLKLAAASGRANAATFFVGEFFKVAATIGILIAAQWLYDVHWLCLLVGLFAALKANLFAFLLKT
ncbi:MAG: ATP synthase subunit I [Rhodocyclaceae bacterium]|jgi:ATP synthase protein I|nr:ATP synthase subunit I [Rhodocyclaceae bacterium]